MKKDICEFLYIYKRKTKAFFYGLFFYIFRVFPIKNNKIIMWTFEGNRAFCCGPKYIAEEILNRKQKKSCDFDIYWLVNDMNSEFPEGIIKIKNTVWNRVYHLTTAKFWITNTRNVYGTKKRKKQIYIQTWHGSPCIKPIGRYRGELLPRIAGIISEYDSRMIDYVLSGSKWSDEHYPDGLFYDGTILRIGSPRCDILFRREEILEKIHDMYAVPRHSKILLYAPTFRGGSQHTARSVLNEETTLDGDRLIKALENRFKGKWYIFLRLHPQLAAQNEVCKTRSLSERIIDVTQHQDMNELLACADAFISDYSSAIFDAMLTKIPCFTYADDLEDYISDRGSLLWNMYELPFPVSLNNDELVYNIENFNIEEYEKNVSKFMEKIEVYEPGNAAQKTVDLVENLI